MHYTVLLPVEVEPTEIDQIVAQEAKMKADEIGRGIDPDSEFVRNALEQMLHNHYESMSSTFAAAVYTAVTETMTPYAEECDDQYAEFDDQTEDLRNTYEHDMMSVFKIGSKYYKTYDEKVRQFVLCEDGVVREKTKDGKMFLSPAAQKVIAMDIPVKEFYKSFKKFADEQAYYDEDRKAWGYYYNPHAIYDWYSIGGRWRGMFLVKDNCEEYHLGETGIRDNGDELPAPNGYRWVSAARRKDIQFDMMVELQNEEARKRYDTFMTAWNSKAMPTEWRYLTIDSDGIYNGHHRVFDPTKTVEEFVAEKHIDRAHVLSRLFYGYVNPWEPTDPYHTHDEYAEDYDDAWAEQIEDFITDFDDDIVLVGLDCHI